jgi:phosphatidylserine/phosphatidylglycerophosphate/cardiolipin synthase-like enzyme
MKINNIKLHLGFGEHDSPASKNGSSQIHLIHYVSLALLGIFTCAVVFRKKIQKYFPTTKEALKYASTAASFAGVTFVATAIALKWKKDATMGITNQLLNDIEPPLQAGKKAKCDVIACEDTKSSYEWKKELIRSANHNIVISGNYCGGATFNEVLDLIKDQIIQKPQLKVVIISARVFIDPSNKEKIEELKKAFPNQFQLVESPDVWMINPSLKKSTNHSKILSIDYGSYFILGGSGLQDKYSGTDGLTICPPQINPSLLDRFLPQGFRDMDFVFHNKEKNGVGRRIYLESLKLAYRWENNDSQEKQNRDVLTQLLDEQKKGFVLPVLNKIEKFHQDIDVAENGDTKVMFMGPEHTERPFEQEITNRFKNAKHEILIAHMYFHPTQKVFDALVEAANNGVKITSINPSSSSNSPLTHQLFVPRNRYNISQLIKAVNPEVQKNIDVREFNVEKITLHKKVIIVDDYVISGSSNMGYKSLVTTSDHEVNFVTKNKELALKTKRILLIDGDEHHAVKMTDPQNISMADTIRAARHRALAFLIG